MKPYIELNIDGVYALRFPYSEDVNQYVAFMTEEEIAAIQADLNAAFAERGSIDELALENKLMRARNERLEAKFKELQEIGKEVIDFLGDECYHDHHGNCQAHALQDDCFVPRLKAALDFTS